MAQYQQKAHGQSIALVDLGSASASIAYADGSRLQLRIDARLGQGHSAETARQDVGEANIGAWLPFYPQPQEVQHYTLNKSLRPATIPMTLRELYLEHGLARANLRA